jgi:hypothetical protein
MDPSDSDDDLERTERLKSRLGHHAGVVFALWIAAILFMPMVEGWGGLGLGPYFITFAVLNFINATLALNVVKRLRANSNHKHEAKWAVILFGIIGLSTVIPAIIAPILFFSYLFSL